MNALEILALFGMGIVVAACFVWVWLDDSPPDDASTNPLFDDWYWKNDGHKD